MLPKILFLLFLACLTHSLLTSKFQFKQPHAPNVVNQTTKCNSVDLSIAYNYTGIVRSGYLAVNKGNSVLAFTFYGRKNVTKTDDLKTIPTIIWLSGGPGKSSQYGNLHGSGPFIIKREFNVKVVANVNSWVTNYNVLYIDQPVGTGLSYADPTITNVFAKNMDEVANDFYFALDQLYNFRQGCFSASYLNIPPSSPLIIYGEGYAGKFAPAIANKIVSMLDNRGFLTGLKGVVIGNAFTQPYEIMAEIGTYAFHLSLLDHQQRTRLERILLNGSRHFLDNNLTLLQTDFQNALHFILQRSEVNQYNIDEDGEYQDFLTNYFTDPAILKLYGMNSAIVFDGQGKEVFEAMSKDYMKGESRLVENLLGKKINVLIVNGQNDLTVSNAGAMRWIDKLFFDNASEFQNALFQPWRINGKVVGSLKKAGLLELRIVNKAGMLIALDRPLESLDLITNFIARLS